MNMTEYVAAQNVTIPGKPCRTPKRADRLSHVEMLERIIAGSGLAIAFAIMFRTVVENLT